MEPLLGRKRAPLDGKTERAPLRPAQVVVRPTKSILRLTHCPVSKMQDLLKPNRALSRSQRSPFKVHLRTTQDPLRLTECSLWQIEGLYTLIKGSCGPTDFPVILKQGPLRAIQGLVRPTMDLLWASQQLLNPNSGLQFIQACKRRFQTNSGSTQADKGHLRAIHGPLRLTECPLGPKEGSPKPKEGHLKATNGSLRSP